MFDIGNLFLLPGELENEEISEILAFGKEISIERIISTGQASPEDFWYDQEQDEWVVVLQGSARLAWEDGRQLDMHPGDWVLLPAHQRHRVDWTSKNPPCIWLAVFGALT
jgi:cupin 2 domain-containing protein